MKAYKASLWLGGFAFLIAGSTLQAASTGDVWVERFVAWDGLASVAFGNGIFVDVGKSAYSSPDGVFWTRHTLDLALNGSAYGVAYGNGRFVALEANTGSLTNWTHISTNGIRWQRSANLGKPPIVMQQLAFCGGTFLALGYEKNPAPATGNHWLIMDSTNGFIWNRHSGPTNSGDSYALYGAAFGSGNYVVVGLGPSYTQGMALVSSDLMNWTAGPAPRAASAGITFGQGKFVAVGNGAIGTSLDGVQWTTQATTGVLYAVTFAADTFVATGDLHVLFTSTNATDWVPHSVPTDTLRGVAYGNGRFVAGGYYYADSLQAEVVVSGSTQVVLQAVGFVSSPKPGFQVLLGGPPDHPGQTYRLQASPTLFPTSWTDVLTTNLWWGPPIALLDTNATRNGQRFYRVVSP